MARWLIRLPLALLLALLAHGIALWVIAQEMQALTSVITAKADPMFTRQITQPLAQAAPSAAAPPEIAIKLPARPTNRAQAAIKSAAEKPPETPVPEPTPDIPAPTVTESFASLTATVPPELSPSLALEPSPTFAAVTETLPALSTTTQASVPGSSTSGLTTDTLAMQGNWPIDTRLTYDLGGNFRGNLIGNGTVQWTRDPASQGESYQVRIELNVPLLYKGVITSQGTVSAQGLLPRAYEEQLGSRPRNVTLDDTAVVLTNGTRIPRPRRVEGGPDESATVQDAASQFVELGHRFANGRAKLAEGEQVRVWLARPNGLDEWVFDVGAPETIDLPSIGPVQAYHLKPRPLAKPRGSMVAEMWFAPSLQYLPVRIKITLNQDAHVDLKVQKIEQR